jgi:hypothetical protein
MNLAGIDMALEPLVATRDFAGSQIAWLAVSAIALHARNADPEITTVLLYWDEDGDQAFMSPGNFYALDGTDLHEADPAVPAGPGPRRELRDTRIALDQLTEAIRPYCTYLDETNTGTWQDVTTELAHGGDELLGDGDKRLYVALVLALDGPPRLHPVLSATGIPPVIDARHDPQPHPCPGAWQYAVRNDGGHEVFTCTGGHHLIAPHPLPPGRHQCTAACLTTEIPAASPA